MAEESFEDYGSGGLGTHSLILSYKNSSDSSPFGNPAFRRSINRKSGRFRRPRPDKNSNLTISNGNGNLSGTDATVESDIEDLTDAMGTMSRRIMRIEEERQGTFFDFSGIFLKTSFHCFLFLFFVGFVLKNYFSKARTYRTSKN